jgi:prepilin-type processing-associated H-X9-DG protein
MSSYGGGYTDINTKDYGGLYYNLSGKLRSRKMCNILPGSIALFAKDWVPYTLATWNAAVASSFASPSTFNSHDVGVSAMYNHNGYDNFLFIDGHLEVKGWRLQAGKGQGDYWVPNE